MRGKKWKYEIYDVERVPQWLTRVSEWRFVARLIANENWQNSSETARAAKNGRSHRIFRRSKEANDAINHCHGGNGLRFFSRVRPDAEGN